MSRVMIITGSRKGIGRYLAEYYLEKGIIVVGCSRTESDLKHENYEHYQLDVYDENGVRDLVRNTVKKHQTVDYLINNAGIASMNHSFLTPLSIVEKMFRTNVFGTFLFTREVGKVMSKKKFGRIINMTTFAVPFKLEGEAVYAASKAAVTVMAEALAREYAEYGITLNTVAPPAVQTDLIKNVKKEKLDKLLMRQAIHRFGHAKDVANTIDFFLRDESDLVTGQTVYLGGV
ncbi:MAG: SDR family oxidoreductase [Bacteroidales bacterium]|nr:SDR family oxidoreductase [Bacteroidales bacterium]MBN2757708.1 SDR family oxidoreductase [Bacteroidales bacterium]